MPAKRPFIPASTVLPSDTTSSGKRVKFSSNDEASHADGFGSGDSSARIGGAGKEVIEGVEELELEGVGGSSSSSKNKVIESGYDSDSSAGSDGGFGIGGGRQGGVGSKNGKSNADSVDADLDADEDSMFAPANGETSVGTNKVTGKEKEFLEMGDIEGQEFGKGDDESIDSELNEEEEEDYIPEDDLANDDDAPRSKRSKSSMGYKLSSFNMAEELAEGRFSADGSYVTNKADPLTTHDIWLEGVSKAAIKSARESKRRMDEAAKARDGAEANGDEALAQQRDDCLIGLLSIIREGESVTKALARLGAQRAKNPRLKVKKMPKIEKDAVMEVDEPELQQSQRSKGKSPVASQINEDPVAKKIETLTHFASTLLSKHGEIEIYDESYEDIIKTLKSEGAVRRDWVPPRDPDLDTGEDSSVQKTAYKGEDSMSGSTHSMPLISRPSAATTTLPPLADGKKYFYKWNTAPPGVPKDTEYGPYNLADVAGWVAGSYFGADGSSISLRAESDSKWTTYRDLVA